MKLILTILVSPLCLLWGTGLYGQAVDQGPEHMIRIFEDNDFMNVYFRATDNAYTNGTSINLFYLKATKSSFILDRLSPKAGQESVNVFGWGLNQIIFTPDDLSNPSYQPDDYPYSAALFGTHTLYSYNPGRKFDFQTEWVLGVRGPASLGQQTQDLIHQWGDFKKPRGWTYQEGNQLLININMTAEKQLFGLKGAVELIGGANISAGTMMNALAVYPELRIGKMAPYFKGYISQYAGNRKGTRREHFQLYFRFRPTLQYVLTDALLQGKALGADNPQKPITQDDAPYKPFHDLSPFVYSFRYGGVLTTGHIGISFDMNFNTTLLKGLYSHEYGNVTVYYNF